MKRLAIALALAGLAAGCFTVDTATSPLLKPDADEHVIVRNYGWYLFGVVPLVCGNPDLDSFWGSTFFSDEVTLEVAHDALMRHAAKSGREVRDIAVMDDREALFSVPLPVVSVSIPWVVQKKKANVSATLMKTSAKQIGGAQ